MNTSAIIKIARKHVDNNVPMASSARVCLADAIERYDSGDFDSAAMWARKSLAYSVGVLHKDYQRVA